MHNINYISINNLCESDEKFIGIGLYYDSKRTHELCVGDIIHVEKDKFDPGRNEVWTIEYEAPAFIVFNQLNSDREIEEYEYSFPDNYYFCPDGMNQLPLVFHGNRKSVGLLEKLQGQ